MACNCGPKTGCGVSCGGSACSPCAGQPTRSLSGADQVTQRDLALAQARTELLLRWLRNLASGKGCASCR